jgi:hypothetical protein
VYFAASAAELVQRSRLGEAFPFFNATTSENDKDPLNHKRAKSVDTGTTAATAAVNAAAAAAASAISSEQSSPRSYTGEHNAFNNHAMHCSLVLQECSMTCLYERTCAIAVIACHCRAIALYSHTATHAIPATHTSRTHQTGISLGSPAGSPLSTPRSTTTNSSAASGSSSGINTSGSGGGFVKPPRVRSPSAPDMASHLRRRMLDRLKRRRAPSILALPASLDGPQHQHLLLPQPLLPVHSPSLSSLAHSPSAATAAAAAAAAGGAGVPVFEPPPPPLPPAPIASELAMHLLVTIAVDNLVHSVNGAAIVDLILGSALDISSIPTLGPAAKLLSALTLERMQVSFRVTFCRALLMRVLQAAHANPALLFSAAAASSAGSSSSAVRLPANLPRMLESALQVVYSYHYFRERVLNTEPHQALLRDNAEVIWLGGLTGGAFEVHLETAAFTHGLLQTWRAAADVSTGASQVWPTANSGDTSGDAASTPRSKAEHTSTSSSSSSKKGGMFESLFGALLPTSSALNKSAHGGAHKAKAGSSSSSGAHSGAAALPDWALSAQAVQCKLLNLLLSCSAALRNDTVLIALGTLRVALNSGLLLPSQGGDAPAPPEAFSQLTLSPVSTHGKGSGSSSSSSSSAGSRGQASQLLPWEKDSVSELCRHLYFFLFDDSRQVRETAMALWRALLLTAPCRPLLDALLTVVPPAPPRYDHDGKLLAPEQLCLVTVREGNELDGFGLLMRQGDWEDSSGGKGIHPTLEFQMWLGGIEESVRGLLEVGLVKASMQTQATRQGAIAEAWSACMKRWTNSRSRSV